MSLIVTSDGREFEAAGDESILDAALRAGVILENSCGAGWCWVCKAKSISGSTEVVTEESGLAPDERLSGWILTCDRKAPRNSSLDAKSRGDWQRSTRAEFSC